MTINVEPPSGEVRYATDLKTLCREQGLSRRLLIARMRQVGQDRQRPLVLPDDDNLERMIRQWVNGHRGLSAFYADLLTEVFGVPLVPGWHPDQRPQRSTTTVVELRAELARLRAEVTRLSVQAVAA